MLDYVASLLPRIQQYSKGLNDTAIFADIPWGFIDDDGDKVTYIFRRNNELLVSKKGDVTTGHWEYLPVMQSLLIEHGNRKRMYNQGFVDNVVMALRKDGTEEIFLLANQQAIPDMEAVKYLEQKDKSINKASSPSLSNKQIELEIDNPHRIVLVFTSNEHETIEVGNEVVENETKTPVADGVYSTYSGNKITIQNGRIKEIIPYDPRTDSAVIIFLILAFLVLVFALLTNKG